MGPFFAAVAELFPISQCYTGLSVGYNIGVALFGGTAPLVVTFLIEWSGNVLAPAFYLSFCATLSLAITFPLRNRAPAQAASAEAARQEALISLDPWSIKRRRHARACGTIIQAMPTPRTVSWTLLPLQLLLATLTWLVWPNLTQAVDYGNEVTVEIEPRHAVATSLLSGRRAILLDAHETVISSGASGINAVVVTSRRLLGFSSRTLSWSETDRDLNEKVLERRLLPTFSVVRTDKHLYGFRGANGIWLDEALGVRETVKRTQTTDYGAVFVTNERLVGFASLLGDFSSKALGVHERVTRLDNEKGLIIVTTSTRTLVFGSRLSGWEEFE